MSEEGAATATEPEAGKQPEGKEPEGKQPEKPERKEGELGPEGEKALEAFKGRARAAEKAQKELEDKLGKIEEANKSESEKALDKARKEARKEAETEFEKERRSDRLQVAISKHARDLADVDDVVLNIQRGDTDELFDSEGKVQDQALDKALEKLLKAKPHLKATGQGKPVGDADGGKGTPAEGGTFNDAIRQSGR